MKILKHISAGVLVAVFALACNDGIDPISKVDPGPDEESPTLTITAPIEGAEVRSTQDVMPIDITLQAEDDIEVSEIVISLDGNTIATLSDFKDYRRAIETYRYETLTNGEHILSVTVKDLSGKSTTETVNFQKVPPYIPVYDGEIFYMPFDGDYIEQVTITTATKVGSPTFSNTAVAGKSYAGAASGYLTLPTTGLLGNEFSAAFWYNLNAAPDRSGILTISAVNPAGANLNNLKNGFRFFREGSPTNQTFKLNVGFGTDGSWFDGGGAASLNPATTDWVHMAFTISETKCVVYINGAVVSEGAFAGVDWTGCDLLSIASGAPRFIEWGHLSDQSLMDELRLFNKALTQEEVQTIMGD
jgi:hypothetical protein